MSARRRPEYRPARGKNDRQIRVYQQEDRTDIQVNQSERGKIYRSSNLERDKPHREVDQPKISPKDRRRQTGRQTGRPYTFETGL
jgi:hypothetical protein